jgi:hypothetical protein
MKSWGGVALFLCAAQAAFAQELEPRRWSHLPIDVNYAGAAYVYTSADIAFDPVLGLEDVTLDLHTVAAKYIRTFELLERLARVELTVPYQDARWEGLLQGEAASRERTGFADPIGRIAVNLVGAPPLPRGEFGPYRATHPDGTTVGAGLSVQAPLGQYYEDRLLNLGDNRFTFRPELGVEHTHGRWMEELTGTLWLFTDNNDFLDGNTREQDPLYGLQGHLIYTLRPGLWLSSGLGYFLGGESTINGIPKDDERGTLLMGCSVGFPVNRTVGIKLGYIGSRMQKDVGSDSDSVITAVSMLW